MENVQPEMGQQGMVPPEMGQQGIPGIAPQEEGMFGQGDAGEQMASPEQKQQLLDMIEGIRQKLGDLKATRFAGKNKIEQTRKEILRRVFEILQLSGVDLENRESVAQFLDKLRGSNPQLAEWFESSMDVILGGENAGDITQQNPNMEQNLNMDLMAAPGQNQYENTDQNQIPPQVLS